MAFTSMFCRFSISYGSLISVIERACTKNSRKPMHRTWLFGASWWMFIKALLLYEIVHVNFFFDRRNSNSECPGQWQGFVYVWLAGIGTLVQSHVTSHRVMSSLIIIKVWKDFRESLYSNLVKQMLWKSTISQKLIFLKRWY